MTNEQLIIKLVKQSYRQNSVIKTIKDIMWEKEATLEEYSWNTMEVNEENYRRLWRTFYDFTYKIHDLLNREEDEDECN